MLLLLSSTSSLLGLFLVAQALVVVVDRHREHALGRLLADHVVVQVVLDLQRRGQVAARSRASSPAGTSSRMISLQRSMHSSQMNTDGPAISFLTSCWLLPQNEQ
jgi:hypothetical protein